MWKEIANMVAAKCEDPEASRPYPVGIIEKAMHEAGFSIKPGKGAKSQVWVDLNSSSSSMIVF